MLAVYGTNVQWMHIAPYLAQIKLSVTLGRSLSQIFFKLFPHDPEVSYNRLILNHKKN